jgi:hypothetical protein
MARKRWSAEIKAQAMADLAAGMTIKGVMDKYGMPKTTAADLAPSSKRGAMKVRKIANLHDLEEVFRHQLALNFAAQEALLRQVCDAEWLSTQSGADVVGLYSTIFNKSGKLLGALYGPAASAAVDDSADPQDAAS